LFFINLKREEIKVNEQGEETITSENKKMKKEKSKSNVFSTPINILNSYPQSLKSLPKILIEMYKSNSNNVNNIIIFAEFIKEFISIILHKFHLENTIENMYELYSKMLDQYYVQGEEQEVNIDNFDQL